MVPWITINGAPAVLLDLPAREFTFFGKTFLPTDTLVLMLFVAGIFVTIFLLTALFGRIWCGWACPQTVYMEFLYRPIERLFARRGVAGKVAKYVIYAIVSFHLAHTFLAYFVGVDDLLVWTRQSPLEHPGAFLMVIAVTGLILFDFGFFREQVCIVMCPYGRFQSVMLDRQSLIVAYDEQRGEPRGKVARQANGDVALPQRGDCARLSPLREDLPDRDRHPRRTPDGVRELHPVHRRVQRGDEQAGPGAGPHPLLLAGVDGDGAPAAAAAARVVLYPALLLVITTLLAVTLIRQPPADIVVLRTSGTPYETRADGIVVNELRVKVVNRSDGPQRFDFEVVDLEDVRLSYDADIVVAPEASVVIPVSVLASPGVFTLGKARGTLVVHEQTSDHRARRPLRLQGPWGSAATTPTTPEEDS